MGGATDLKIVFQREIVDRAVLSLKDAGVPSFFDRVKKLAFRGLIDALPRSSIRVA
jgi:hypothetical protein